MEDLDNEPVAPVTPADPSELTKLGKIKWEYANQEYKQDLALYTPLQKARTYLLAWTHGSVNAKYKRVVEDVEDLRVVYANFTASIPHTNHPSTRR